jgi:hypothetical protein
MNDKLSGGKVGLGGEGQQWPCDDMGASVPSITGEGCGYSGQAKWWVMINDQPEL